ncbi:hypothetical protein C8R46DRAFT_1029739 [Mycena filopes]|nr:hypothetical protein C8R46DRAFT_1029739 [Mycena filopes]
MKQSRPTRLLTNLLSFTDIQTRLHVDRLPESRTLGLVQLVPAPLPFSTWHPCLNSDKPVKLYAPKPDTQTQSRWDDLGWDKSSRHYKPVLGLNRRSLASELEMPTSNNNKMKVAKLTKPVFYTPLLDLHRSNPFAPLDAEREEEQLLEAWCVAFLVLSKTALTESTLLYTRRCDILAVGIVLMQMLCKLEVMARFSGSPGGGGGAVRGCESSSLSLSIQNQQHPYASEHLAQPATVLTKKNSGVSSLSLLADLAGGAAAWGECTDEPGDGRGKSAEPKMPIPGSLEFEYFRAPQRDQQMSRWKEDWEELEMLGKGAFGLLVWARNKIYSRIYAGAASRRSPTQRSSAIVRSFTSWVETARGRPSSSPHTDDGEGGARVTRMWMGRRRRRRIVAMGLATNHIQEESLQANAPYNSTRRYLRPCTTDFAALSRIKQF